MKALSVFVMVMGDALEVKQFVMFLVFMSRKRTKACRGQRLPAHAKDQKQGSESTQHPAIL